MNNIDIFDSYYMAGIVQEMVPPATFFKDRYFPTVSGEDIFAADKVLVEYQDGDRRMAPFVAARAGDMPIERKGYEVYEFQAPNIMPSRILTMDDLNKRGFGEALFAGTTPAERAIKLQMKDLKDLDGRITRREEWMAAQTMINNGCTMIEYIDNTTAGEPIDMYFYDVSGGNPALYTVSALWDSGGDFGYDVEAMCAELADRGLSAADLVVGSTTAQFILSDDKTAKLLDNRRMEFGHIAPKIAHPGVAWLGKLNFGGFELDIFSVRETYQDEKGIVQRYFPAKSAMVTAPGCGHTLYAQITQIEPDDQYHTFAMPRVPKFVVDRDKDTRKLRLGSRPLTAPKAKAPWMYAPNVIS